MKKIKKIILTIPEEFRGKFYLILIVNFCVGILEMLTIASILPLMIALVGPQSFISENFSMLYNFFSVETKDEFALILALIMGLLATISVVFSILNIWLTNKFIFTLGAELSSKLFNYYMFLDLKSFMSEPTSELVGKILLQTQRYADGVIGSFLIIFQKISSIMILTFLLLIVNFKVTIFSLLILSLFYYFYFRNIKKKVSDLGLENTNLIQIRQKILQDNLNCAKELKIYDKENLFIDIFRKFSLKFANNVSFNRTVSSSPRYVLELVIIILALFFMIYYFNTKSGILNDIIPIATVFVFSIYKIMPSAQSIFSSLSSMNSEIHAYDKFKEDLKNFNRPRKKIMSNNPIQFENEINFKNISFNFQERDKNIQILDNVSFKIRKNEILGIFGKSGSGKTTLLNIISSLLVPEKGEVYIDDLKLDYEQYNSYKKNIAFVTQSTMVFNDTIEKNITLYDNQLNKENLDRSIKLSGLDGFVASLPDGLETKIGEKGSKISGGQLQRISIARAIYNNRKVLLLDEFTSALDPLTESKLLNYIKNLKNTTIILSTHKLELLNFCNSIIGLKEGKIVFNETVNADNQLSKTELLKAYI